jgi:hypothetical protein
MLARSANRGAGAGHRAGRLRFAAERQPSYDRPPLVPECAAMIAGRSLLRGSRALGGVVIGAGCGVLVGAAIIVAMCARPEYFEAQRVILLASAGVGALAGWRLGPQYFRWGDFLVELLSP